MSTTISTLLNAVSANTTGTALDLSADERYQGGAHSVEVTGTFTANVLFEATIDGSSWNTLATVTTVGLASYLGAFHSIRASVSGYVSGNVTVKVRYGQIHVGIDTLLSRLSSVRAGYLDELDAPNLPTDIAVLLARLTSARAGYLDELAAANIPADVDTVLTRLTPARALLLDNLSRLDVAVSSVSSAAATGISALSKTMRKLAKVVQT